MNHSRFSFSLLILLSATVLFSGCKDDDDEETPGASMTKTERLVNNDWVLRSVITDDPDYSYCEDLGNGTYEVFECSYGTEACFLDDFYDYDSDGTYTYNTGAMVCEGETEGVDFSGTWEFDNNETQLEIDDDGFITEFDIVTLSATALVLEIDYEYNGELYFYRFTYD